MTDRATLTALMADEINKRGLLSEYTEGRCHGISVEALTDAALLALYVRSLAAGGEGQAYVYEDQLPEMPKAVYDALFEHSWVDGVRLFPAWSLAFAEAWATAAGQGHAATPAGTSSQVTSHHIADASKMVGAPPAALDREALAQQRIADVVAEWGPLTKEACDACEDCAPLVMCDKHSILSALLGHTLTNAALQRPAPAPEETGR